MKYDSGHVTLGCTNRLLCLRWHICALSWLQALFMDPAAACMIHVYKERECVWHSNQSINRWQQCVREAGSVAMNQWRWCSPLECVCTIVYVFEQLDDKNFPFYVWGCICVCLCVCVSVVCHRGEFSAIWALLSVSVKEPHYFICYSLILHNGTHIDGYLVRTVINALSLQYWAIGF